MNQRTISHGITQARRQAESGVALLTVLALLSIFAVVLVGFTYSIRMEENTIKQYADSVTVEESTEAAIQGVLAQLARDLDPSKPNYVLGRLQPKYTSLLEPWAIGYAGKIGERTSYDARSHQLDVRPQQVFDRSSMNFIPTPIPRGVDEDPPGDVTGSRRTMRAASQQARGDGAAGLKDVDDDLDGEADGSAVNDDDEDYRSDEDPLDQRRDGYYFPAGTGYDQDGDRLGVFDECASININFAGNNFGQGYGHIYNLGVSPSELDLPVFLFNRVVRYSNESGPTTFSQANAESLANAIVSFRYGDVTNGGTGRSSLPGQDKKDDNNNGNPKINLIQAYSDAYTDLNQFDGEPFAIVGNGIDDDGDGLYNEEDEHYIGPSTDNSSGSPLSDPFDQDNPELYRPGDKIDNNGNGFIDEDDEGTDEPAEFNVFQPKGDDRPYSTVEDLKLVGMIRGRDPSPKLFPTLFDILKDSTTIYSQTDEISGPLSAKNNEVAKINPNLTSNWLAADIWNLSKPTANRADFQYSPKVKIEDMLALQVDNDGDWQIDAEINLTDGKDNDGDGQVDEPSDDWDGNRYASGDFDGAGEGDVGAPAYATGGDYDFDQLQQDKLRTGGQYVYKGMRMLGWAENTPNGSTYNAENFSPFRNELVEYDERPTEILPGLVVEGNGHDDDGDLLIDDVGDFNGDSMVNYDPEFHVSEDAWGDLSGDGYPGLGADPEADPDTREGRIIQEPDNRDALLKTSLADDDYDGYADFYDPQVLAAMYAPEWDGVDNDNDGAVDELGERYIACFDDDEDGRMDEDPPEFQIALNLVDFVDAWMPFPVSEDKDVRQLLGKTQDEAVLADPVTFRTFTLYSTRQRAFRMHPRIFAGPNFSARDRQKFAEQMRLMLPNPAQIGMKVQFEGVEAIRINEVMAKPVIRLEAEDVLETIQVNRNDPQNPVTNITYDSNRFEVSGNNDDGLFTYTSVFDTNWGVQAPNADDARSASVASYQFMPNGFQNTYNPFLPIANMDSLAPAFIFSVTNIATPAQTQQTVIGTNPTEEGIWRFENIPAGFYDVVLYMSPQHRYRPEVDYYFNGSPITFRSDTTFGDVNPNTGPFLDPYESEIIRRDTATFPDKQTFRLNYRLTPFPIADKTRLTPKQRVVVGSDGILEVKIVANEPNGGPGSGDFYETSFDRLELISPWTQYVELVNLSTEDIDLSGWTLDTPYGHYILPEDTIIGRMKPSFKDDDGRELPINQGLPGDGVPTEPLLSEENVQDPGSPIASLDLLLEDNKLLVANHKQALTAFIKNNYPDVPRIEDRIVEPILAPAQKAMILRSLSTKTRPYGSQELRNAQQSDLLFRLVDVQEDILTNNPADKHVTLSDPSGHYVDSFKYRTTFNNAIVDIMANPVAIDGNRFDMVALPGYKGMESFERADPTQFETKMAVDNSNGRVSGVRSVPSSIKLDVKDAILLNLDATQNLQRSQIGGYVNAAQGVENDRENPDIRMQRFVDRNSFPANDAHWNGWDFIGDYYEYPKDFSGSRQLDTLERTRSIAREAVAPSGPEKVQFYDMLGGFENSIDVNNSAQTLYTAFVWRMGLRELIRAGYDPDVDDQLTVRVLGRKAINDQGVYGEADLPVGEVLVVPLVRVLEPGAEPIDEQPKLIEDNPASKIYDIYRSNNIKQPIFAKLRNGDTAFSFDLRQQFNDLNRDLKAANEAEPQIEITIVMRKSSRDLSASGSNYTVTPQNRPDLIPLIASTGTNLTPDADGNYRALENNQLKYIGNAGDDNYFFRGIELFGRGRKGDDDGAIPNARRALLAGTPGRDNTGYTPAYPRRRLNLSGKQRDQWDIVDNTGYVKNGPLATVGELSRVFTGNKFETINTPMIPQRLEDIASAVNGRVYSSPKLAQRAAGNSNPTFRKALAQRERLDQWENQYTQLYNMITTAESGIRPGVINVNTASREVLSALPFCPPAKPGQLERLQTRYEFNNICADFILEGRQPGGHDMLFGVHDLDDDDFMTRSGTSRTLADTLPDFKLWSVGREFASFKVFDDIESNRFDRLGLTIQSVEEDKASNIRTSIYLSTEVSEPDDGPYSDIGALLTQITHLRRRDRFSELMVRPYDRTMDLKVDDPGDLRERLNETNYGRTNPLTTEEMEAIMNRISNLITVRSRAFSIVTKGRIFDSDGNITAQRKLEAVYQR